MVLEVGVVVVVVVPEECGIVMLFGGVEKSKSRMGVLNFLVGHARWGPPRETDWGGAWPRGS